MQDWKSLNICTIFWWVAAFVIGIATYSATASMITVVGGLILGLAVFAFLGVAMCRVFCQGSSSGLTIENVFYESASAADTSSISNSSAMDAQGSNAPAAAKPTPAAATSVDNTTAPKAAKTAAKKATPKKTAPKKTEKKKTAAKPAAKPKSETKSTAKTDVAASEAKPESLAGPRDGKADNLKEIKGIGPKLEQLCNSMGFYHFDQIASWSEAEVAWVDDNLAGFKGRVSRDNWIEQAKVLASGGETEFSKRVEDGDVY